MKAPERIACMRLIDAPFTSLVRRSPELADELVVVLDTLQAHGRIVACSPKALSLGISVGVTAPRARAIAPSVLLRAVDRGALHSARAALVDVAVSRCPRVEPDVDRVFLDAGCIRSLYDREEGLTASLTEGARKVGLSVLVGIAGNKEVARVAASRYAGGVVVPEGKERDFLAPMPLAVLPLRTDLRVALARLGVRSVAQLAAMNPEDAGLRWGEEGANAVRIARGEALSPLFPKPHAQRFEEQTSWEWSLDTLGPLFFVCKRLLDGLVQRLTLRGFAAADVHLSLQLQEGGRDERSIVPTQPSRDAGELLHLLRASLEAHPPSSAVVGAAISARGTAPKPLQLGLFDPPGYLPERYARTLARLRALLGEERVGTPFVPDTHRPLVVGVRTFAPVPPSQRRSFPSETVVAKVDAQELPLALHVFRPPLVAQVIVEQGQLLHVQAHSIEGSVRAWCGPFRVEGGWWEEPFAHDAYDIELQDGGVYLLGFDRLLQCWRLEGVYG